MSRRYFALERGDRLGVVDDDTNTAFALFLGRGWRPVSVEGIISSFETLEISEEEARIFAEEDGDSIDNIPFKSSGGRDVIW